MNGSLQVQSVLLSAIVVSFAMTLASLDFFVEKKKRRNKIPRTLEGFMGMVDFTYMNG